MRRNDSPEIPELRELEREREREREERREK